MFCCLLVGLIGAQHANAALIRDFPGGTELVVRGKSFASLNAIRFAGGSLRTDGKNLIWQKGGREEKVDLREPEMEWLADDGRWGGHQQANELRYIAGRGGGFDSYVTDLESTGEDRALAVLSLVDSASISPPRLQLLVMVQLEPLKIELIRSLAGIEDGEIVRPAHLLYHFGKSLYLNSVGSIDPIDSRGNVTKPLCVWGPGKFPLGVCGDRWLVSMTTRPQERLLEAADLSTGKSRIVFDPTRSSFGLADIEPYELDSSGPYVFYSYAPSMIGNAYCHKFLTIHIPDGVIHVVPGSYFRVQSFGPYLAAELPDGSGRLFLKESGREVGSLTHQ